MKKFILILFLFQCSLFALFAQKSEIKRTTHWYFGAGAGLDFSSGLPVPDTTGHLYAFEGCSTMSDTAGNLLFYTNADTVWNKNHQPMPNGIGLLGCGNYTSSANAGLIVPKPGSNSIYYIFTTDCWANSGVAGFRYSIVDMSLNSGLGDITDKNHLLFAPSQEGCAATKACNGTDFWVVTHENGNNNFCTYKIDSTGIDSVPIISSIGYAFIYWTSYFRFSNDGSKFACGSAVDLINGNNYGYDQIFDFDNITGRFCNYINLNNKIGDNGYSPIFSPDDTKLYYDGYGNSVYQYDLSAGNDSASISNTVNFVGQAFRSDNSAFGSLQYGPDLKIYISSVFEDSLSVISSPNNYGSACNFLYHTIYLGGKKSQLGFPLFIENYFSDSLICNSCVTVSTNDSKIGSSFFQVFPNPANIELHINTVNHNILEQVYILQIYDALGNIYKQLMVKIPVLTLNVSSYPPGLYLLKISTQNTQFLKSIIINH